MLCQARSAVLGKLFPNALPDVPDVPGVVGPGGVGLPGLYPPFWAGWGCAGEGKAVMGMTGMMGMTEMVGMTQCTPRSWGGFGVRIGLKVKPTAWGMEGGPSW